MAKRRASSGIVNPPKFEACEQCNGTGWVPVMRSWGTMMVPSETRCVCFKAHQSRLADLERAQQESK